MNKNQVEKVIWCFWTGDNEMSENRKKGYKAQIIYNIPFDNRTNRILNKQN